MEHPYVEFINRVQMKASKAKISGTALFNNEGTGFGSTITMRDVITNYIYPNTLAVIKVSGVDLRAALEQSASYLAVERGRLFSILPLSNLSRNTTIMICIKGSTILLT